MNEDDYKELVSICSELLDALIWASGSYDFSPGGKARAGCASFSQPAIERAINYFDNNKEK